MTINPVEKSNPYGATTLKKIIAFEVKHELVFPDDYRQYLLDHNGGKFRKLFFLSKSPGGGSELHHIFGLHKGPGQPLFSAGNNLARFYDLGDFSQVLSMYFVFADSPTGSLLLLNLDTKEVCVFEQDDISAETDDGVLNAIHVLADSFTQFVESLLSSDEYDDATMTKAEQLDFAERRRQIRREAGWPD